MILQYTKLRENQIAFDHVCFANDFARFLKSCSAMEEQLQDRLQRVVADSSVTLGAALCHSVRCSRPELVVRHFSVLKLQGSLTEKCGCRLFIRTRLLCFALRSGTSSQKKFTWDLRSAILADWSTLKSSRRSPLSQPANFAVNWPLARTLKLNESESLPGNWSRRLKSNEMHWKRRKRKWLHWSKPL